MIAATDPDGVSRVEFYAPGASTPFASDTTPPYETTFTVPSNHPVGTEYVLRARALDPANHSNELLVRYSVRAGTRIVAPMTISATDLSFEDQVIAVNSTLTLAGHHRFAALLVLSGTVIPVSAAATTEPVPIDLEISGDVYVGCGASVSASSRGYANGKTFALEPLPGTGGGVHGGRGFGGTGAPYGSPIHPVAAGSGAEGSWVSSSPGGGAVHIAALSGVVIDGSVLSNGFGRGAGGSVFLEAASLAGGGRVEAQGGARAGGGRIALVADSISEELVARTSARGGLTSASDVSGGAGTLYLKDAASIFGTLIVDNAGSVTNTTTELVPIGTGVVESVDAAGFTAVAAEFRHSVVGGWLALDGDFDRPRRILGHAHRGRTLVLDPDDGGETPIPGATYEGFWRFDQLIVRGQGHLLVRDPVQTTEAPEVAPGSTLTIPLAENTPSASIQVDRGMTVLPNQSFQILLLGADLGGVSELRVTLSGRVNESMTFPGGGQASASAVLARVMPLDPLVDHVDIHLEVENLAGVTTTRDFLIAVPADTQPPAVSISSPVDGTSVVAGTLISIVAAASDDVGLRPTILSFGAISTTDASPPSITASLYAPPVAVPTSIPIEVRAEDYDHNVTTVAREVLVTPSADTTPPVFTSLCPAEETMAQPGDSVQITATWSDNMGLYAVERYIGTELTTTADGGLTGGTQFSVNVPVDAPEDSTIPVRLRVIDFGGNITEQVITIRVRTGIVISGFVTIGEGDLSYEDQTIYVARTGRLTVDGPHRFRDLILQSGAWMAPCSSIRRPRAESVERLEIELTDSLYVGCSASVNVNGLGYPGATAAACTSPAFTFPGTTVGGAVGRQGGSHGGIGGNVAGREEYGSLFAPREAGGGGGCQSGSAGGSGGGVVRIRAAGSAQIDGSVDAGGRSGSDGGGAGGSVWIEGERVGGSGSISVRGGSAGPGCATASSKWRRRAGCSVSPRQSTAR